eukprot:CAMPEP_0194538588 /NCGR_PEP_ID=MMETSP0253-20130528/78174_1 /TAXON_ID=2966 /ORGANISM="Noctiluca scintillans" /LENGTH=211 /DNA_ID=CAMNT_0039384733 /DNA_START=21 /DNA_END=655 /DNA_ORIENTATION=+
MADEPAAEVDGAPEVDGNPCKIFVGNLPYRLTANELANLFRRFGVVIGSKMVEDRSTGKKKGFGFVTFAKPDSVEVAIEQMHDEQYEGRPLTVKRATARGYKGGEDDAEDQGWTTMGKSSKGFKSQVAAKKEQGKLLGWGDGDDDWGDVLSAQLRDHVGEGVLVRTHSADGSEEASDKEVEAQLGGRTRKSAAHREIQGHAVIHVFEAEQA